MSGDNDIEFYRTREEILRLKNESIWFRIDSIMKEVMTEFCDDNDSIEENSPWETGEQDIDESSERWQNIFTIDDLENAENDPKGLEDIDFAFSALSVHEAYQPRSYKERKQRKKRRSFLKKNKPKVNFEDLQAKSDANVKLVNQMYGQDSTKNTNPKRTKEAMFSMRMSVDPMFKAVNTINAFRKTYKPKEY